MVTSVLGLISGKADKFVFLFHLLGLALTSCSWLQISVVINNSNSPVDFPNLLVEFSYACLSGMITCNRDHVKSYYFYYKLSFSPWIQTTSPFHIWFGKGKADRLIRISFHYSMAVVFIFPSSTHPVPSKGALWMGKGVVQNYSVAFKIHFLGGWSLPHVLWLRNPWLFSAGWSKTQEANLGMKLLSSVKYLLTRGWKRLSHGQSNGHVAWLVHPLGIVFSFLYVIWWVIPPNVPCLAHHRRWESVETE